LSSIRRFGLLVALGVFAALSGPPTNLYAALWLGMAGLAYVLADGEVPSSAGRARRWLDGAGRGLAFGFGANLVLLRFVPPVVVRFTALPYAVGLVFVVVLAALQGLTWCVAGVVARQLGRRGVPAWLAFGIGAYVATFTPGVFVWSPAGLVTPVPEMVQLAEIVGERGVTLLMALTAGLFAAALRAYKPSRRLPSVLYFASALALTLLVFGFGKIRIARVAEEEAHAKTMKVGLVQPATDAVGRWDNSRGPAILARLKALTESSESLGAELTVWPESAYPFSLAHDVGKCPTGARAVLPEGVRGPVLSGFLMVAHGEQFNSAAICTPDGALTPPEDKIRLLAFGETIPLIGGIRWVRRAFHRGTGLSAGQHNVVEAYGPMRASVLICVEDSLVDGGREAMADRPNLLVNLTNDAWFQGSRESELHLRLAALRSVESRRDMIRAVNLGPTSWVDAAGIVRARYDSDEAGVLMATPALLERELTPFDRFGDIPTALALALAALYGIVSARRRRG
jgi:apolipoprotein N-acyltransferase